MPDTVVQDPSQFRRLQGIDVRDDADTNTLSDAFNVYIDSADRLTRPKAPLSIVDWPVAGSEAAPITPAVKSAVYMVDQSGSEVYATINSIENATVTSATVSSGVISINGTGLQYFEVVMLMKVTGDQCFMSGIDFTASSNAGGTIITCTATSTYLVSGDHIVIWLPTQVLTIDVT